MCGVAAIHAYHYAAPAIRREELSRMAEHMRRRGPDGQGMWFADDGRSGLAHRRLAIIDLDERAAQPMVSSCGRYRISFNGEIYNYVSLRQELERAGMPLRTRSDTEVLLELFAREGTSMLRRLRGMFAFVIHDLKSRRLWLARDPYGIKPLYLADDGWTVRVASQARALIESGSVSRRVDPAGHAGFLLWGSVPDPFTMFRDIRAVPAGSFIEVSDLGPLPAVRYQTLVECFRADDRPIGAEDLAEEMREAFRDSVRAHMVADVPVGAFLSGGVDSGAVVGLMASMDPKPVQAATIVFDRFADSALDESSLAASVANRYGAQHSIRRISDHEIDADLPDFLAAMDQPSIDGFNVWFAAKSCSEVGLRVAMSGIGGDELLGGYPSFSTVPKWRRVAGIPSLVPGFGRLFRAVSSPLIGLQRRIPARSAGFFELAGSWAGAYLLRRGLFMPWELGSLMGPDEARAGLEALQYGLATQSAMDPDPGFDHARVLALESALYLRNQLLRDCDWAAMAHSLEVRTPLVDIELLRRVAPLLRRSVSADGKSLLATSPRPELPADITNRKKTGFATPMAHGTWSDDRTPTPSIARRGSPARNFARWIWDARVAC